MKHANASQICSKHIVPSHRSAMIYDEIVHAKNCSVTMPTDQSILVQPAVILWQIQNNCSNTNKKNQDRQNETNITRCPA
jgi:hypothetical protein